MNAFKKILVSLLTLQSRLIIKKYKPFIVAVTGSVGKTSTKDAIYCVLRDHGRFVRKSEKSMNSDIGLPLTVIGVPNAWKNPAAWLNNLMTGFGLILKKNDYPDCLILEIGADHPGDIKKVSRWLNPDIVVITKVSRTPVHVEFFKSPEEVFEEKASLAKGVKNGGTVILFADDEKIVTIPSLIQKKQFKVISFGADEKADIRVVGEKVLYVNDSVSKPAGMSFGMDIGGVTKNISINGILGKTYQYPLLAAAAVGVAKGIDAESIAKGLLSYEPPKGRMRIVEGLNGTTVIDDTYNSSPDAALSALQTLKNLSTAGKKIAVLGDMMELGKYASDEHRRIGKEAAHIVSMLVTVGPRSKATADEAVKNGLRSEFVRSFDTASEAAAYLAVNINAGDIILVKGSQSIRMERVVKALLARPELAEDLLVRQEREWLEKR